MSRRLLGLCVLAYPRVRRQLDGPYLRDLALELAGNHGIVRQAVSLLCGGVRERIELRRSSGAGSMTRVIATSVALAAVATVLAITLAGSSDHQVEAHSCVESVVMASGLETREPKGDQGCAWVQRLMAAMERRGWDCGSRRQVIDGESLVDLECRTGS